MDEAASATDTDMIYKVHSHSADLHIVLHLRCLVQMRCVTYSPLSRKLDDNVMKESIERVSCDI